VEKIEHPLDSKFEAEKLSMNDFVFLIILVSDSFLYLIS
jgi:hypothetical protein